MTNHDPPGAQNPKSKIQITKTYFKFKCGFLVFLLVILFSDSIMAFAAGAPVIPKPGNLPGITVETQKTATAPELRAKILNLVPNLLYGFIGFIAISSVVVLIISGIMFLTAYGSEETVGTAKKAATYAIVGLLIAIFSYAIVKIVVNLPLPT